MAWDRLLGDSDEYGGDLPMDAFGRGLRAAEGAFRDAVKRQPYASELAEAFAHAIANAPDIGARERTEQLLARWLAMPRVGGGKRPKLAAGDIVRIPYAADGLRAIYARVLFVPERGKRADPARKGPGLGPCWVVHDLDVPAAGDLDPETVRAAPILMGPLHVSSDHVSDGRWRVVGHVTPDDAELPTFGQRNLHRDGSHRDLVVDYFGNEIAETPENEARKVQKGCGGPGGVEIVVKMLRGYLRYVPAYGGGFAIRSKP